MKKVFMLLGIALLLAGCQPYVPQDLLSLSPESLADRQLQTRRFETTDKASMLSAASAVLQDLGFTLEESEGTLGLLVASKTRDATSGAQMAGAILIAALGGGNVPVDSTQRIRVSMVMREIEENGSGQGKATPSRLTSSEISGIKNKMTNAVADGLVKHYPQDVSREIALQIAEEAARSLTDNLSRLSAARGASGTSLVRVTFQRVIVNTANQVTRAEQIRDVEIYKDFYEKLSKSIFLEAHEI